MIIIKKTNWTLESFHVRNSGCPKLQQHLWDLEKK